MTLLLLLRNSATTTHFGVLDTMQGLGTATLSGTLIAHGVIQVAGEGILTVAGKRIQLGVLSVSGEGILNISGRRQNTGAITMSSTGTLSLVGTYVGRGSLSISGTGSLTIAGLNQVRGAISVDSNGTLTVTGKLIANGIINYSATGFWMGTAADTALPVPISQPKRRVMASTDFKQIVVSTTTTLGGAGVFTSGVIYTDQFSIISGVVTADQNGTLQLLALNTASNAYVLVYSLAIVAGVSQVFYQTIAAQFYKIQYTNGGVAQGSFALTGFVVN